MRVGRVYLSKVKQVWLQSFMFLSKMPWSVSSFFCLFLIDSITSIIRFSRSSSRKTVTDLSSFIFSLPPPASLINWSWAFIPSSIYQHAFARTWMLHQSSCCCCQTWNLLSCLLTHFPISSRIMATLHFSCQLHSLSVPELTLSHLHPSSHPVFLLHHHNNSVSTLHIMITDEGFSAWIINWSSTLISVWSENNKQTKKQCGYLVLKTRVWNKKGGKDLVLFVLC